MIPKIEIRYSQPYLKVLFDAYKAESSDTDFDSIVGETMKMGDAFASLLRQHEKQILSMFPEITGYDWDPSHSYIPVYPVYPFLKMPSFSDPLTLKVREDALVTFGVFLHELSHINISEKIDSVELQERTMTSVAVKIMKSLSLEVSGTLKLLGDIYAGRFNEKLIVIKDQDIESQTVREYLILQRNQ